jgi:predicted RNA-binding Zn-ribbon protein involved in translation (DUF1610 family)
MDLNLPLPPNNLASRSQIARVVTECWIKDNIYCTSCGLDLASLPQGTKIYDFHSPNCGENFQLKSSSTAFSNSILGSEYRTIRDSILRDVHPSLLLLHYDQATPMVWDLSVVHGACITTSCIIPRKPLASTARRAGWQGCNRDRGGLGIDRTISLLFASEGAKVIGSNWLIPPEAPSKVESGLKIVGTNGVVDIVANAEGLPRVRSMTLS